MGLEECSLPKVINKFGIAFIHLKYPVLFVLAFFLSSMQEKR